MSLGKIVATRGRRRTTTRNHRGNVEGARWATTLLPSSQCARYHHICDKGFEQFNMMDVRDDATGLMVPRERKKPREHKKRPPPPTFAVVDGSESRSGRVRKATKR